MPDGYEALTLGTDPLLSDSDGNGVTDDVEDNDSDGLTSYQEFLNKTDPNSQDSDGDGLLDGDEVNTHQTDPLQFDTDGDTIGDGDEIKLGLNPTTQHTANGILDSEVKFDQTISSAVTDAVNTSDNPFTVNISLTATGYADRNLAVGESGYASVMSSNNAIQGEPVELVYENGSVEKARITFDLNSSLVAAASSERTATSTPLERYHIFRFDEEYNLLYPVNTIEEGNSIYTESDKLGTYCVMDLVEWDKSLKDESQSAPMIANFNAPVADNSIEDDILLPVPQEPLTEEEQQAKIAEMEKQIQLTMDELLASESQQRRGRAATAERQKMDILVAIDSTGLMARSMDFQTNNFIYSYFTQSRYFVSKLVVAMNRANVDWRMCLVDFKLYPDDGDAARTIYPAPDGSQWITTGTDILSVLDTLEQKVKTSLETRQTPWDALGMATRELVYRDGAARHAVLLSNQVSLDENRYGIKDIKALTGELISKQVYTHYITSLSIMDRYQSLLTTGGFSTSYNLNFILEFPQHVVDSILKLEPHTSQDVKVITSYGLDVIDATQILGDKLSEDLDSDGLTNQDEIRGDLMDGNISVDNLLTLKEFVMKIDPSSIDGFQKVPFLENLNLLVLPLKSDPRYEDSDGDWLLDSADAKPLNGCFDSVNKNFSAGQLEELQEWLVSLGYLNMDGNPYGASYGILTHAAVNIYRLNHGMPLTEDKTLDSKTYALIANDYFSKFGQGKADYSKTFSSSATPYADNLTIIKPDLPQGYANLGIKIVLSDNSLIKSDIDSSSEPVQLMDLYLYDYTNPINAMLKRNSDLANEKTESKDKLGKFLWFYSMVNHDEEWDIKVPERWIKQMENIVFYSSKFPFVFDSNPINPEDLGNILYGYAGYSMGITESELILGSEFASITGKIPDTSRDVACVKLGIMYYCSDNDIPYIPVT